MSKRKNDPVTRRPPSATQLAKERDEYLCQWHLVIWGVLRPGAHGHHLFRPRDKYNQPEYIITLCEECHSGARHTTGSLTDRMLIDQVMIPYIWGGENRVPKGFL